ncbi:hypothetical protein ACS0TY_023684 [Phlomoides rotata]
MELDDTTSSIIQMQSDLQTILKSSLNLDLNYQQSDEKFEAIQESLNISSRRVAPLQSLSIANKALETRIKRAISPGLGLIESFRINESLQRKLLETASELQSEKRQGRRLKKLIKYVDCVDKLKEAINSISLESEGAIQKLQEVVEFLSRTKATDEYRTEHLRETLVTLRAVCETEIDCMRFDGVLDEALLNLQDEYEGLLQRLKHGNGKVEESLGSDLEVEVLRRISHTLAANDCLDLCIDLFVKVRYRRAAKALMKLSPDYLKTYTPEEIDEMEWESLETAISLWIQHFEVAVKTVVVSEKTLSNRVLGNIQQGITIWPECFVKISDKIMAVFFRFGEGVARSNREPQKLFKLLDMFDSLEALKPEFTQVFEGEPGSDICTRFRELEKLLVHASTRVFWEFGLQIEGNHDGLPPPHDGSVPKLVRYAINYLKNLTLDSYSSSMAKALKTEQVWKGGILSDPENDQDLLKNAISNVMEAIQRNIESKKSRYKDKLLSHIFSMNTYWYIYMRTKNTELGKVLGEAYMKKRYRKVAEESAYLYQKQAWGGLVRVLEREEGRREREMMEAFIAGFDDMYERHRSSYKIVSDADLREQMKDAAIRLVVPAYTHFLNAHSSVLINNYPPPESIESMLTQIFEVGDVEGKQNLVRRDSYDRKRFSKDYRRSEFEDIL